MEIRNEVKQKNEEKKEFVHRSLADIQRNKLNKLMQNPEKPVVIPDFSNKKEKEYQAPSFVRNVMGSSAGAGSGEFHVYRHLRRKEYSRQKFLKAQTEQERLDQEFQAKLEENRRLAEEKTNKKREKRKKKKKNRGKGKKPKVEGQGSNEESEELSEQSDLDIEEKVDEDSQNDEGNSKEPEDKSEENDKQGELKESSEDKPDDEKVETNKAENEEATN